jgi:hypothetical protein
VHHHTFNWINQQNAATSQVKLVFWFEPQLGYRPSWLRKFLFFLILSIEACAPRQFDRNDNSYRSSRLGRDEIGDRTGRCALTLPCIRTTFLEQCYLESTGSKNSLINTEPKEIEQEWEGMGKMYFKLYWLHYRGWTVWGSNRSRDKRFFIFLKHPEWLWGLLSFLLPGVKRTGPEVKFLPPCSAAVKNEWSYFCTPFICVNGVDREHIILFLSAKRQTQNKGTLFNQFTSLCPWWQFNVEINSIDLLVHF